MLARLAHDLEIASTEVGGTATSDGASFTAELVVPVASLRVVGARKGDRLDTGVLSEGDRAEIERKIRVEVFEGDREVACKAEGSSLDRGEVALTIGGVSSLMRRARLTQTVKEAPGGGSSVEGRAELSLSALGIREVKGPLNAFRVADTVEVLYKFVVDPE